MRVLDLYSGIGSATITFREHGHEVITVDIDRETNPTYCLDLRVSDCSRMILRDFGKVDFAWASPPCEEYSQFRHPQIEHPDLTLWFRAIRIMNNLRPTYWIIENVSGAIRFWGRPPYHYGAWYLWGYYPPFIAPTANRINKTDANANPRDPKKRAMIPRVLAEAIHTSICQAISESKPAILEAVSGEAT